MSNLVLAPQATVELPSPTTAKEESSLQAELHSVFESYATLYPNPRLSQERQDRESLIRALSAAGEATERNPKATPSSNKKGLWGRLFGGSTGEQTQDETILQNFDETRLKYINEDDEADHSLCGTENFSLDVSCIPPEAYMVARFRIASRQQHRRINAVRNYWQRDGTTVAVVITGLGQLVEVPEEQANPVPPATTSPVWSTSDRAELQEYLRSASDDLEFSPERVRACMVGSDFMMVSWGLADGVIVCYRKVQRNHQKTHVGWQAMARISPTSDVKSNLADMFSEDDKETLSPLLTVTDMAPLVVETGDDSVPDVSVALARLGGYIEIVPLSSRLWYESEVKPRKSKSGKRGAHYASSLPDLAHMRSVAERIVTIPTTEYHGDVIGLEAFRTRVKDDTVWDQGIYPDRPPAEHVLIAHGCDGPNGTEQMTFWAVSTLFSEQPDPKVDINFSLHATLVEAIDLGPLVPPATLFASDTILRYWRKPRQVMLKEPSDTSAQTEDDSDAKTITTISLPMPLSLVRASRTDDATILAVLDSYGGLTLLDCSLLERLVSQCLSDGEHQQVMGDTGNSLPLADFLFERNHVVRTLSTATGTDEISRPLSILDVAFLPGSVSTLVATDTPALAILAHKRLFVVSMREFLRGKASVSLMFGNQTSDFCLHLGSRQCLSIMIHERSRHVLQTVGISSPQDGFRLIERMIQQGKDFDAVRAAESLGVSNRSRLQGQLDSCRRRLWEQSAHLEGLLAISDVTYQLEQVLSASEGKVLAVNKAPDNFDLVRAALAHVMDHLRTARLGSAVAVCGSEGVDAVLARLRRRYILLGSYELVSFRMGTNPTMTGFAEDFLPVPISDIALALARQGDMETLAVLYFRHSVEIDLEVIEAIPLSIEPSRYQHLIPVAHVSEDDGLLFSPGDRKELKSLDFLESFLTNQVDVESCISDSDRVIVCTEHAAVHSLGGYWERGELEKVLLRRIQCIELSCGSLDLTGGLCDVALRVLRADALPASEALTTMLDIKSNTFLLAEVGHLDGSDTDLEGLLGMNTKDFTNTDPSELVLLVLGMGLSPEALLGAINTKVRPNLSELASKKEIELDNLVTQGCRKLVSSSGTDQLVRTLRSVTSVCLLSRSSLMQQERLVKEKKNLLELVSGALSDLTLIQNSRQIVPADGREIMEQLWTMYECLPRPLPDSTTTSGQIDEKADYLRSLLIVGDIASRWPGCNFLGLLQPDSPHVGAYLGRELTIEIVREMCSVCLAEIDPTKPPVGVKMVEALVLDLQEIAMISVEKTMDGILTLELFTPLLRKMQISALQNLLTVFGKDLFDRETARDALISFTSDAVFSSEDGHNVEAAIACEESLGEFYPELKEHFESIRQSLNVSHFVNSVLYSSTENYLRPDTVRESGALDVLRIVLATVPIAVVKDCEEWSDERFGAKANHYFRQMEWPCEQSSFSLQPRPRLPCVAVFHLAELLGLVDDLSVVAVKGLSVEACLLAEHFGAAAAICRTLFDGRPTISTVQRIILRAVASVVQDARFLDDETKIELCHKSFCYLQNAGFRVAEFLWDSGMFSIMTTFQALSGNKSDVRYSFPLSLCHEATKPAVFARLRQISQQAAVSETDQNALMSLGNEILKEVVGRCISGKDDSLPTREDDLVTLLDLGLSVLCHCTSYDDVNKCFDEIEAVLESSEDVFAPSASSSVGNSPDETVVQKLVGMGYNEIGARRAASMGSGFNEALRWAVAHSLEPDFNEPIVILKKEGAPCGAELYGIATSKVKAARVMLTAKVTPADSWCPTYRYEHTKADSGSQLSIQGPPPQPHLSEARSIANSSEKFLQNPQNDGSKACKSYPLSAKGLAPPGRTGEQSGISSKQDMSNVKSKRESTRSTESWSDDNSSAAKSKTPDSGHRQGPGSTPKSSDAPDRVWTKFKSRSPPDPTARDALRKMGLDALNSARSTSKKTEANDRQRLIEEGRRLLALARPRESEINTVPSSQERAPNVFPRQTRVTFGPPSYHSASDEETQATPVDPDQSETAPAPWNGRTSSFSVGGDEVHPPAVQIDLPTGKGGADSRERNLAGQSSLLHSSSAKPSGKRDPHNGGPNHGYNSSDTPSDVNGSDFPTSKAHNASDRASEDTNGWDFDETLDDAFEESNTNASLSIGIHNSPSDLTVPNNQPEKEDGWNFDKDPDGDGELPDDGWGFDDI